jgi:hypothetical protein
MISDFDRTLEALLEKEFGSPLPFDLSWAIPDKNFSPVSTNINTLNCYLYDISENRELRRVDPQIKRNLDGTVAIKPSAARIKLSYCITAWSPASLTPGIFPMLDEHSLLSDVLAVLLKYPVIPEDILVGSLAGQKPPLPTTVIFSDGGRNHNEFWTSLGGQLRPALDYAATISLDYLNALTGPMVTHRASRYGQIPPNGTADEVIQIGGHVTDDSPAATPIPDAWVRIEEMKRTETTDKDGRFRFGNLRRQTYTLRVRAAGFHEATRSIQVPQPFGDYNVQLTPL